MGNYDVMIASPIRVHPESWHDVDSYGTLENFPDKMQNESIVEAEWLKQALQKRSDDDPAYRNLKVLDCTFMVGPKPDHDSFMANDYRKWDVLMQRATPQKDAYSKSHIPTAVHMDIEIATYPAKTERFATHPPKLFEEYVRLLGINSGDQLVLYDRGPMGGMLFASKIWWLFKMYGHEHVALLNGGFSAWQAHGFEVSDKVPDVKQQGDWKAPKFHPEMVISFLELTEKDALGQDMIDRHDQINLLDARPSAMFYGETDTTLDPKKVSGSFIPGFKNVPAPGLVDKDGRLKTPAQIKEYLINHGFHEGLPVVTSCALGIQAGFLAFAIKQAYAELPIRIYSGSLKEMEMMDPNRISGRRE